MRSAPARAGSNQKGFVSRIVALGIAIVAVFALFHVYKAVADNAPTTIPIVRSAVAGYCLDDLDNDKPPTAIVDTQKCNGSDSENWLVIGDKIEHDTACLSVQNGLVATGSLVELDACTNDSRQSWTVNGGGFENANSGYCLANPGGKSNRQLILASCDKVTEQDEAWAAGTWTGPNNEPPTDCSQGGEGQKVACVAEQQWFLWEFGTKSHTDLLNTYSDGNGYEEWCADFVSYVYKQAGYPFANGERAGWDEYDANNVQYQRFVKHAAGSYIPRPGDVAFFDYSGGHVEIVATGGRHPTFIYGDAGTVDPATGNGDMNENTLTSDGSAGQVVYYLSPSH